MKNRSLYGLLVLLAFAMGFSFHLAREGITRDSKESASTQPTKSGRKSNRNLRSREIRSLTQGLEKEGGLESWLSWLGYLENASAPDFPRFLDSLPENSAALDLLVDRWVEVDPEHCWAYLLNKFQEGDFGAGLLDKDRGFSLLLFSRWAQQDLEGAIASLDEVEDFPYLYRLQKTLADKLAGKDVDRAIRYAAARHLFTTNEVFYLNSGKIKKWIRQDPTSAANLIFSIESRGSSLQSFGVKELSEEWAKLDPRRALRFGIDAHSGLGSVFAEALFAKWSKRDFAGASDWLAVEASDEEAKVFTPTLIATWSQSDPEAALQWTQESLEGDLLASSVSRILVESAFAKDADPQKILAQIENQSAYDQAAGRLAKALWGSGTERDSRSGHLKHSLQEQVAWFDDVAEPATFNQIAGDLIGEGVDGDIGFLKVMAQGPRAGILSENNASNLLQYVARKEPEEAMGFVENFRSSYQDNLKTNLILQWMRQDSGATEQWFQGAEGVERLLPRMASEFTQRVQLTDEEFAIRQLKGVSNFLREPVRDVLRQYQANAAAHPADFAGGGDLPDFKKLIEVVSTGQE